MLRLARGLRSESQTSQVVGRHQRPAHVDGAAKREQVESLSRPGGQAKLTGLEFAQNKFLDKSIKIYLE